MVHVIATISVKPGSMSQFLNVFKANVPTVTAEAGCIEYRPTVDLDTGMPRQILDPDTVILVEKWSSLDALKAHLGTPHMLAYREKVKDLVFGTSLRIMQDA